LNNNYFSKSIIEKKDHDKVDQNSPIHHQDTLFQKHISEKEDHNKINQKNINLFNIPDHAKIHVNISTHEILIPLFTRFRFDQVDWYEKNYSFNI